MTWFKCFLVPAAEKTVQILMEYCDLKTTKISTSLET